MEVRESAACGISLREFVIEFDVDEIVNIYRIMNYAQTGIGFYDDDFLDDLKSQMTYIIGASVEEEPEEDIEEKVSWEDTGTSFNLNFTEPEGAQLYQIFKAVETPGKGFNKDLNQKLLNQMLGIAPSQLQNLPIINR
jgi:hypothetical protein